jgi:peptide/nickel transport system permease protein
MLRALAGRLLFAVLLVLVAFVAAFVLTALAPGDEAPDDGLSTLASAGRTRTRLGLDEPVLTRLGRRLAGAASLDLGESTIYGRPVLPLVLERTANTLRAGLTALVAAMALGVPFGVLASRTRRRPLRVAIVSVSVVLLSLPALVIALLLSLLGTTVGLPPFAVMTISLTLPAAALIERLQARAMTEALDETCLRAVQARGVPRAAVTWRHAWPLSLPAVLGVAGIVASHLVSGALAVELITGRSGLGLLTWYALNGRDANLASACAAMAASLVGVVTLVADATLLAIDPRLRVHDTPRAPHERLAATSGLPR